MFVNFLIFYFYLFFSANLPRSGDIFKMIVITITEICYRRTSTNIVTKSRVLTSQHINCPQNLTCKQLNWITVKIYYPTLYETEAVARRYSIKNCCSSFETFTGNHIRRNTYFVEHLQMGSFYERIIIVIAILQILTLPKEQLISLIGKYLNRDNKCRSADQCSGG